MSDERDRRWRLALGDRAGEGPSPLSEQDRRIDLALAAVYEPAEVAAGRKGGLGASAPRVARWLDDLRELFPTPVVKLVQHDAFDRLNLKQLLLEPEFLETVEADVHLVADLMTLRGVVPEKAKAAARQVVEKVVRELIERLADKTVAAVRGALDRGRRTTRPRPRDVDWHQTIRANLRHWQVERRTIVAEKLIGYARRTRQGALEQVVLCVDQSGSMAPSVVYASIFSAVLASIPSIRTRLVVFDTAVVDLTEQLADPVDVLFGIQLGGGTDIASALRYCEDHIEDAAKTHLVLISDLYEGGDEAQLLARAASLVLKGVNVVALLALSDEGKPMSNDTMAARFAALGIPVFACTPDLFPDLMAAALQRQDLRQWAAERDIAAAR